MKFRIEYEEKEVWNFAHQDKKILIAHIYNNDIYIENLNVTGVLEKNEDLEKYKITNAEEQHKWVVDRYKKLWYQKTLFKIDLRFYKNVINVKGSERPVNLFKIPVSQKEFKQVLKERKCYILEYTIENPRTQQKQTFKEYIKTKKEYKLALIKVKKLYENVYDVCEFNDYCYRKLNSYKLKKSKYVDMEFENE